MIWLLFLAAVFVVAMCCVGMGLAIDRIPDACRENGRPTKQLPLSGFYNEEVRS